MHLRTAFLVLATLSIGCPVSSTAGEMLSYGCGGGVTGGGGGAVIHHDGRISRWTIERAGSARSERTLPQNREGAARLFALLEELRFENIDFDHPFYNIRCSLTLTTDGRDHTVSWGDGRFPIPVQIQQIVDEVEKLSAIPSR